MAMNYDVHIYWLLHVAEDVHERCSPSPLLRPSSPSTYCLNCTDNLHATNIRHDVPINGMSYWADDGDYMGG